MTMSIELNPEALQEAMAAAGAADAAASAAHHAAGVAKANVRKHWRPGKQSTADRSIYGVTNAAIKAATLADDASLATSEAFLAFRKAEDFFDKIEDIFGTELFADPSETDPVYVKAAAAKALRILSYFGASARSTAKAAATASDHSAMAARVASEAFYAAAARATHVVNLPSSYPYGRATVHAGDFVRAGEAYLLAAGNFEQTRDAFLRAMEALQDIRSYSQSLVQSPVPKAG